MEYLDIIHNDDDLDEINLVLFGIPRRIYQRTDYLHSFDDMDFVKRFRLSKETALFLLGLIEEQLEFPYDLNNSVAPINQLLIFLRYCATGSHIISIADFIGTHTSTASRIIARVTRAIAGLSQQYIQMPQSREEIGATQLAFYQCARFPKVLGAIDCTHIRIQSPGGEDAEVFRNRKNYFSMNVQVICNAHMKINNLITRWPGSVHDVTIFNNSRVRHEFETDMYADCLLLGDSGYNVRPYLMTPLANPITRQEQLYNESHIRTRNVIERFFGVWKRRFPVLAYGCRIKLETIMALIVALGVVHNICIERNEDAPLDPEDVELFLNVMEEDVVPHVPVADAAHGFQYRRNLIENYFETLID